MKIKIAMDFIQVKPEPFEEVDVEEQPTKQESFISESDFVQYLIRHETDFVEIKHELDAVDGPIKQEIFDSKIDIEEHPIQLEPEEDLQLPEHNRDEEPKVYGKLAECRVLVPRLLKCQFCSFYTHNKIKLAAHMQAHHTPKTAGVAKSKSHPKDRKTLKCARCDVRFSNPDVLAWHTENCHGSRPTVKVIKIGGKHTFQCIFCATMNSDFGVIIQHLCSEHRRVNLPFRCKACEKLFLHRKDLNSHLGECVVQVQSCEFCHKMFKSEHRLRIHITKMHTARDPFKCQHCQQLFTSLLQLKCHCLQIHPGKPFAECKVCQAEFNSYNSYQLHIKHKHGPHVFTCSTCSVTFTYPANLNRHMQRQHSTLQNPLYCKICSAKFKCKEYLDRHVQFVHSGPFLYCEHCDYSTRKKYHLVRHFEQWHI